MIGGGINIPNIGISSLGGSVNNMGAGGGGGVGGSNVLDGRPPPPPPHSNLLHMAGNLPNLILK